MFSLYSSYHSKRCSYYFHLLFLVSLDSRTRARVVNNLQPSFSTIAEAEAYYNQSLSDYLDELAPTQNQVPAGQKTGIDKCTQTTCTSHDCTEAFQQGTSCDCNGITLTTDNEAIPIPADASEILIIQLAVNVTDRNLLLLLSQLCRSVGVTWLLDLASKLAMLLPRN